MDWVVWAEGFDAEEPSEVLCLVAVLALIRQLYRNEDTCGEMSAVTRAPLPVPAHRQPAHRRIVIVRLLFGCIHRKGVLS